MSLRAIASGMAPNVVAEIDARLATIEEQHAVAIPLAIESGSRAWGFPSPDSDYDCRFVFVRSLDHYLSPWPRRDVIETPLEGAFDVNGWELGKALKLLLRGNAVILEWLRSPIVYSGDSAFRDDFLALAEKFADRRLIARHYLHLGERQRRNHFSDGFNVPQKKIFYALRPAAALRWLRLHPEQTVPPMHFPTLMDECEPPASIRDLVADLMSRKAVTRELGVEPLPAAVGAFIDNEFDRVRECLGSSRLHLPPEAQSEAEHFFRATISRLAPEGQFALPDTV